MKGTFKSYLTLVLSVSVYDKSWITINRAPDKSTAKLFTGSVGNFFLTQEIKFSF